MYSIVVNRILFACLYLFCVVYSSKQNPTGLFCSNFRAKFFDFAIRFKHFCKPTQPICPAHTAAYLSAWFFFYSAAWVLFVGLSTIVALAAPSGPLFGAFL